MNTPLFSDFETLNVVSTIKREGGAPIKNFLQEETRHTLLEELAPMSLQLQPQWYGAYQVQQSFSSVSKFPVDSTFEYVRVCLQRFLNRKFQRCRPYPLCRPITFTEMVVQRYPPGPLGIGAHRDGKSFINLVAVIVLEGMGRFCFCDNRERHNIRPVDAPPGTLILMRGMGFGGEDIQPFHFVDRITTQRTTLAFRQKLGT